MRDAAVSCRLQCSSKQEDGACALRWLTLSVHHWRCEQARRRRLSGAICWARPNSSCVARRSTKKIQRRPALRRLLSLCAKRLFFLSYGTSDVRVTRRNIMAADIQDGSITHHRVDFNVPLTGA